MLRLCVYGERWRSSIELNGCSAPESQGAQPFALEISAPPLEPQWPASRIDGYVSPLSHAPVNWLGRALRPGEEVVESRHLGVCAHYDDGILVIRGKAPPAAYVSEGRPRISVLGTFGALLHRALLGQGALLAHAAVLLTSRGAVLVFGESRSGKSTLAAAWICARRRIVTDDAAVLLPAAAGRGTWWAESWRMNLGVRPDVGSRLMSHSSPLSALGRAAYSGKLWLKRRAHPESFRSTAPVSGLVFLEPMHGQRPMRSCITRLSQAEALGELLSLYSAIMGKDEGSHRARRTAANLISQLPAARLRVGSELIEHPLREVGRIESLLQHELLGVGMAGQGMEA